MTQYKFEWPKGAELKMDKKDLDEIKKTLELQFKHIIYSQPGFKYYPAMGNTNFFQHFKTPFQQGLYVDEHQKHLYNLALMTGYFFL